MSEIKKVTDEIDGIIIKVRSAHIHKDAAVRLILNIINAEANEAARLAREKAERGRPCAAIQGFDPPQDCDFPFCNCDPAATKVIDALQEYGLLREKNAKLRPQIDPHEMALKAAKHIFKEVSGWSESQVVSKIQCVILDCMEQADKGEYESAEAFLFTVRRVTATKVICSTFPAIDYTPQMGETIVNKQPLYIRKEEKK